MGDVKPWLWGKNPCFVTLLIFHLPLLTSLMLQLVVGGVIAEVVVVVVGCQPYPLAHSTHVCPLFSLTHSSLAGTHSHHDFGLLAPHAQALGDFGLTQAFSSSPRVAKRSGTCNSRPCHFLLTFTQGIVAVTHAQPISRPFSCCCSPTSPGRAVHSSRGLIVSLTHRNFWVLPT